MVDGVPVPTTPFDHPHGRSEDLFLLAEPLLLEAARIERGEHRREEK